MKYKRFIDADRRLGGAAGGPRGAGRGRPEARRVDRQRRHPLGAGAAGGGGGDRRRAARRARAPGRQSARCSPSPSTPTTRRGSTRRWPRRTPHPGDCGDEYRRPPFLTASGDLSHHLDSLPPRLRGRRRSTGRHGPAADRFRQRVGADLPATAARCGSATGSWSAAPRRPTAAARWSAPAMPRAPDGLHPRQDRGQHRRPRRHARGRGAHPHLRARRRPVGGGRPRARPLFRRDPAGQHAGRGRGWSATTRSRSRPRRSWVRTARAIALEGCSEVGPPSPSVPRSPRGASALRPAGLIPYNVAAGSYIGQRAAMQSRVVSTESVPGREQFALWREAFQAPFGVRPEP